MNGKNGKKKKWMRFRHKVATAIAYVILYPVSVLKYGIKIDALHEKPKRQYLILMNHQTPFDQFFVGIAFRRVVYYLATEDIFSNGWISSVLRYLAAPIPIKKQTADVGAVRTCLRVAKEGGNIAIAPEGNRTYSGKTEYMNPSIASLAKALKLPVALFRIEGGYGVHPRWSDGTRKGKMRAYVSRVIEPEEIAALSNEALFEEIRSGLSVNEACLSGEFRGNHLAEYLERAIYVCPDCGFAEHESRGNTVKCTRCGREVTCLPTKELRGVGREFPFRFVNDWYEYQQDYVNRLDPREFTDHPLFRDTAALSEVVLNKRKVPMRNETAVALYGDRIVLQEGASDEKILPFEEIGAATVLGRNKLNLYHDGRVWQLKGSKRFNALKYVNLYHRYKNIAGGKSDDKFLGL